MNHVEVIKLRAYAPWIYSKMFFHSLVLLWYVKEALFKEQTSFNDSNARMHTRNKEILELYYILNKHLRNHTLFLPIIFSGVL